MQILSYCFHCIYYRMATMEPRKHIFSKGSNILVIRMDAIKTPLHSFSDFHNFLSGKKAILTLLGIKQPAWKYTRKSDKAGGKLDMKGKDLGNQSTGNCPTDFPWRETNRQGCSLYYLTWSLCLWVKLCLLFDSLSFYFSFFLICSWFQAGCHQVFRPLQMSVRKEKAVDLIEVETIKTNFVWNRGKKKQGVKPLEIEKWQTFRVPSSTHPTVHFPALAVAVNYYITENCRKQCPILFLTFYRMVESC